MTTLPDYCFLKNNNFWDVKLILSYTTVFSQCCENLKSTVSASQNTSNEAHGDITDIISPFQNCLLCGQIEYR